MLLISTLADIDYTALGVESRLGHNAVGDNQLLQPVRLLVAPRNMRVGYFLPLRRMIAIIV